MPPILDAVDGMQRFADAARLQGKRIALVPTMGALHEGHLSLLKIAADAADVVVCSIFVNPTQFGPGEDFETYPRTPDEDIRIATDAGASAFFMPSPETMYAKDHHTSVDPGPMADILEGAHRPGHFRGVATIVLKLFTASKPHVAVFGQKDAQQLAVIRTMTRDLGLDIGIVGAPIVREPDGLAMSSRNIYLTADERERAASLNRALTQAREAAGRGEGDLEAIKKNIRTTIGDSKPTGIDYVECVDPDTFDVLPDIRPEGTLAVLAVRYGSTRLLDNRLLTG